MFEDAREKETTNHKKVKKIHKEVLKYEYTVIGLMSLLALSSVVWNISKDFMPTELQNAFAGGKIHFRPRDYRTMSANEKQILNRDLTTLVDREYSAQMNSLNDDDLKAEKHTMTIDEIKSAKSHKVAHILQTKNSVQSNIEESEDDKSTSENHIFNATQDRLFLYNMKFYMNPTNWWGLMFFEWVPYISQIVSIFWIILFMLFQSNIRNYSFVPKPWRIVLPTIAVCSIMFIMCALYGILMHLHVKSFCQKLRSKLTNPNAISCGEAFNVLRTNINERNYRIDFWLNLFQISVLISVVLWCLNLSIMLFRYLRAIDFQHVDPVELSAEHYRLEALKTLTYEEVPLNVPSSVLHLNNSENHHSHDDFQSAKSNLSGVSTPLL